MWGCCLCSENIRCNGCYLDNCPDYTQCENKKLGNVLLKRNPYVVMLVKWIVKRITEKNQAIWFYIAYKEIQYRETFDCLEENEKKGIIYHCERISGDYDNFDSVEKLIEFIKTRKR